MGKPAEELEGKPAEWLVGKHAVARIGTSAKGEVEEVVGSWPQFDVDGPARKGERLVERRKRGVAGSTRVGKTPARLDRPWEGVQS